MLFHTWTFAVFFLITYALYWRLPLRGQNILLLIASMVFYGYWNWKFLGLLAFTTAVDYAIALAMGGAQSVSKKKTLLCISLLSNLGVLSLFKYSNFFIASFADLLRTFGFQPNFTSLNVILPVGISFYTFQSLAYTIDVYRGKVQPERSFLQFALFVSFFPQLVAGPIERAQNMFQQYRCPRTITWSGIQEGAWLFLRGLAKKILIADNMISLVDPVFNNPSTASGPQIFLAVLAFAFQIYGDFSGYSDMARGVAKSLGFNLMVNFRRPYLASTPSEFWQRWHISLSTWFRDYLYIPLGGNRSGPWRTNLNLILTMLVAGFWHGAAWTFIFWGLFHGVLLAVCRPIESSLQAFKRHLVSHVVLAACMFFFVCWGWIYFRAGSLETAGLMFQNLTLNWSNNTISESSLLLFLPVFLIIFLIQLVEETKNDDLFVLKLPAFARGLIYGVLIFLICVMGAPNGKEFIYFNF